MKEKAVAVVKRAQVSGRNWAGSVACHRRRVPAGSNCSKIYSHCNWGVPDIHRNHSMDQFRCFGIAHAYLFALLAR